jgi:heme/copper-type cytochrome/quinol oxidase subunit 2
MVEHVQNTYVTFTITSSEVEEIKRPELSSVSVKSTTTNNIFGRTYDDYLYTAVFSQDNNYAPMVASLSVFTTEGEFIEIMQPEFDPKVPNDARYKVGVKYKALISGLLLGEGNHHVYQLHFKDRNTYAKGSIELGTSWHGPYISDNIRPYVRPTAPTSLILHEDDETTYFDLNIIFEDVDLKEELNFTMADPSVPDDERVWSKSYSDSVLDATIVNETRIKIDLVPNANGDVKILLNVTDKKDYYLIPSFEFTIRVLPINDPPQIIQYFSFIVLEEDEVNTDITLAEYFVDLIDFDELTYRAANYNNIMIEIDEDSNVMMTPVANWYGTEYIDFFASDGEEEVTDFLKVIVRPLNDVPVLAVNQTIELWEDAWANFTINATDTADDESVTISHNLTQLFPELGRKPHKFGYTFDNSTGYLTFKPTNEFVGVYSWNISAVDVHNDLNFTHITLIINNVNDPPVPRILFPETGARYLTTDKVSLRGEAHDPDSKLKDSDFIWYSRLEGVTKKLGTGLNLPAQLFENGTHKIILSVRDETFISNATITMNVYSINSDLDSDEDGIPDYWENLFNFNIKDPHDAEDDPDKDTFSNWEEYMADTDPRDPKSMPKEHITKEKKTESDDLTTSYGTFIFLVIILALIVAFIVARSRRRKRKEKEAKEKEAGTEGYIGMAKAIDQGYGKYKPPTVICHRCGKSLKVMTLNRPVAVRCTDCGARGAVY